MRNRLSSERVLVIGRPIDSGSGSNLDSPPEGVPYEAGPLGSLVGLPRQSLFEAAFTNSPEAMMIIGEDHRIFAFNQAAERLTGWHVRKADGRHCGEVCPGIKGSVRGEDTVLCPHVRNRGRERHSRVVMRNEGTVVSVTCAPLPSELRDRLHRIVTLHRACPTKAKKPIEPDAMSAASHELLSPLNLIRGYTSTLLEFGESLPPEQRERYLRGIEVTTNKAVQTVRNFLDVTRLEAKGLELRVEPTFLPELLRKVVTEVQHQTTKHVIKLRQPRSLPVAKIDRSRVEQVVSNLLANAVKYSPYGKNIEVSVVLTKRQEDLQAAAGHPPELEAPCLIVPLVEPDRV